MEVGNLFRSVTSMALTIPRQLAEIANAGSIQNAGREVRGAERRKRIEAALENAEQEGQRGQRTGS